MIDIGLSPLVAYNTLAFVMTGLLAFAAGRGTFYWLALLAVLLLPVWIYLLVVSQPTDGFSGSPHFSPEDAKSPAMRTIATLVFAVSTLPGALLGFFLGPFMIRRAFALERNA